MDTKNPSPKARLSLTPSTLLAPVPVVLVSCHGMPGSERDKANLITLAWVGTICSEPPMISISIRKSRFSHRLIKETGEFVVNLVNEPLLKATDFCGVKSGLNVDKFSACGLTAIPMAGMAYAPAVAESPLSLGCKVRQILELGSHDCFIAEITSVEAAAGVMDQGNRLRLDLAGLVTYVHGDYRLLAGKAGFFGYSVAAPDVLARRLPSAAVKEGTDNAVKTGKTTKSDETKRTGKSPRTGKATKPAKTGKYVKKARKAKK
ncbi:MAG: flavin reductase family protein [Clostridiaceae bacterium]|nr:flavin reductase family protein [Clostridiaceae bacterium]